MYRAMCSLKHRPLQDAQQVHEMLAQFARDGVKGHPAALRVFDSSFLPPSGHARAMYSSGRFESDLFGGAGASSLEELIHI